MSKETDSNTSKEQIWLCGTPPIHLSKNVPVVKIDVCAKCGYTKNGDRCAVCAARIEPLPPRKKEAPESTECPDCFEPFDSKKFAACPFCYVQVAKKKKLDVVFSKELNGVSVTIEDMTKSRDKANEILEKTKVKKAEMLKEKYPLVYRLQCTPFSGRIPYYRDFVDETQAKRAYKKESNDRVVHLNLEPVYTGGFSIDQLLALDLTQAE